ncbi:hypothetical protein EC991_001453 [Linnemannia zychae]|nr:hypothetical protein EC991_001453 [Linnemannia zychae]
MTRRVLTISFSLFLVSAMMGSFPIPGTDSVSIPSSPSSGDGTQLESPLPSMMTAASIIGDTAATITTTDEASSINGNEALSSASALSASSLSAPATTDPDVIKITMSESPIAALSGLHRAIVSPPLAGKQVGSAPQPQKRDAAAQSATSFAFGLPLQLGQQYQQLVGQQGWMPSQGGQQQWHPPQQGGQQWWLNQGGQQRGSQQWYFQQGGQQGQQHGKPYKKRAIAFDTPAPTTSNSTPPTYRMSALVCNVDVAVRGLLHCSDNQNYYTLEQPTNPVNFADPHSPPAWLPTAPFLGTSSRPLNKRTVTYSQPQSQGAMSASLEQGPGAFDTLSGDFLIPSAYQPATPKGVHPQGWFRHPQPYGPTKQFDFGNIVGERGATPEGWSNRPEAHASQPQAKYKQEEDSKVSKRSVGESAAVTQAGATSSTSDRQAAADAALRATADGRSSGGLDTGNLNKWSGGGGHYGGGDDWSSSRYGKAKKGSGKKWIKRSDDGDVGDDGDDGNDCNGSDDIDKMFKWSGGSGSQWGAGGGHGGGWNYSPSGYGNTNKPGSSWDDSWSPGSGSGKKWYKRQIGPNFGVGLGGVSRGGLGRGAYVVGNNSPTIPVPIDVQLLWDGSNVNVVTPAGIPAGLGGPSGLGGSDSGNIAPSSAVGGSTISVPINVDALVYPDGQMQVFPSEANGI